jgi:hypothetical protein
LTLNWHDASRAFVVLAAALAYGCGSTNDTPPGDSGGAAGQGGNAGAGAPNGGSGSSAVAGSANSNMDAGTTAAGGGPNAKEVFNPALARPSYDCRTDANIKECVSIAGTVSGRSIDRHCARDLSPFALLGAPDRWLAYCSEMPADGTYAYRVEIPVQVKGTFDHVLKPGNFDGANVMVTLNSAGGEAISTHLTAGELAGRVDRDPGTMDDVITGTFRATWGMPGASCSGGLADKCAPADVHGTFRVDYSLKVPGFP